MKILSLLHRRRWEDSLVFDAWRERCQCAWELSQRHTSVSQLLFALYESFLLPSPQKYFLWGVSERQYQYWGLSIVCSMKSNKNPMSTRLENQRVSSSNLPYVYSLQRKVSLFEKASMYIHWYMFSMIDFPILVNHIRMRLVGSSFKYG